MRDLEFRKRNLETAMKATKDHANTIMDARKRMRAAGARIPKSYNLMLGQDMQYYEEALGALLDLPDESQEEPRQ